MVRIQATYSGYDSTEFEFLCECQTSSTIQEITNNITEMANLQQQIHLLGLRLLPRLSALLHTHPQAMKLHRALSEATSYASKDQVLHGRPLSSLVLRGHIRSVGKEFATNCKDLVLFEESDLGQVFSGLELLQEDMVQLWWAGKELTKGKTLHDYIGKNEKTKIMLRLQSHISNPACNLAGDWQGLARLRAKGY